MEEYDLMNQLNEGLLRLDKNVAYMAKAGKQFAQAEHDYKVALMEHALKLKDSGMAVTLIDKVVYGKCAKQRLERDIAESLYKTAQEAINATKLRLRLLEAQIDREWGRAKHA